MSYNSGVITAASAFFMWGLLPIYWKQMESLPAYEILAHRMVWSLLVTLVLLGLIRKLGAFVALFRQGRQCLYFLLTATILAANWFIYIWAVNSGFIIEASLGYYINPLVSVCFGVVFLKEKMRSIQWLSVFLAGLGVCYLTWLYGVFPWIAISLASTFACYGLLRKVASVPALEGLCLETAILFIPALAFLVFLDMQGRGAFLHGPATDSWFLIGTGVATTAPLLCFCIAARKIPLFVIGLLQYLAPTISLFVGIFMYGESFPLERMLGFAIIWVALLIFIIEGLLRQMRIRRVGVSLEGVK